jgi:hypothetical protein
MKIYLAVSVLVGVDIALSVVFPLSYQGASRRVIEGLDALDKRMAAKLAVSGPAVWDRMAQDIADAGRRGKDGI